MIRHITTICLLATVTSVSAQPVQSHKEVNLDAYNLASGTHIAGKGIVIESEGKSESVSELNAQQQA